MVSLALPPADHLLIERDRGQFVPSRRRRMMANVNAAEDPRTPELLIPGAAAQTRMVSVAKIRLDSRKSVRSFKGIICVDISEFESHMPVRAARMSAGRSANSAVGRRSLTGKINRGPHVPVVATECTRRRC